MTNETKVEFVLKPRSQMEIAKFNLCNSLVNLAYNIAVEKACTEEPKALEIYVPDHSMTQIYQLESRHLIDFVYGVGELRGQVCEIIKPYMEILIHQKKKSIIHEATGNDEEAGKREGKFTECAEDLDEFVLASRSIKDQNNKADH